MAKRLPERLEDLRNDHNVYILGAGFSRAAGFPLINDFLVRMRDSHEWLIAQQRTREATAVQKVLEFRLNAASAAYWVNLDLENIEELFSLASASKGKMDVSIRIAIAATLDFIRQTGPTTESHLYIENSSTIPPTVFVPPDPKTNREALFPKWLRPAGQLDKNRCGPFLMTPYGLHVARLLGMFLNGRPKGENTFITFNYDTVLEDALNELKVRFGDGISMLDAEQDDDPLTWTTTNVYKLHGSIKWQAKGKTIAIRDYEKLRVLQIPPVIVPPTWKKVFDGPLERVWESAVQKLKTATRIVIIGFSIPPTDMHFKYLLAAGLQNNVSLRQIVFVNPDASGVEKRVKNLLRNSYVDSGLIDFSPLKLEQFTGHRPTPNQMALLSTFGNPTYGTVEQVKETIEIDQLGRPVEPGLRFSLYHPS